MPISWESAWVLSRSGDGGGNKVFHVRPVRSQYTDKPVMSQAQKEDIKPFRNPPPPPYKSILYTEKTKKFTAF
jgi:hypothetical protein